MTTPDSPGKHRRSDTGDRCHARTDLLTVDEHRTGTTLRKSTTELRAAQVHLVAEHVKKHRVRRKLDVVILPVDVDRQLRLLLARGERLTGAARADSRDRSANQRCSPTLEGAPTGDVPLLG